MNFNKFFSYLFVSVLALLTINITPPAFADELSELKSKYRYRFVNLTEFTPAGTPIFRPVALNDKREVYFDLVTDETFLHNEVAVYRNGKIEIVKGSNNQMFPITVNKKNTVLATQFEDIFDNGVPIDRIFNDLILRNGEIQLLPEPIPPNPGEIVIVLDINDRDQVFYHALSGRNYQVYSNGILRTGKLNIPPEMEVYYNFDEGAQIEPDIFNNNGEIAGLYSKSFPSFFELPSLAFRHNIKTGKTQILNPKPGNNRAWGKAINNSGFVLGISFGLIPIDDGSRNIGVWDRQGKFITYVTESFETDAFQRSGSHVFNDKNEIVASGYFSNTDGYLTPKPGVRLALPELVENLPEGQKLSLIVDINNHGDMIGFGGNVNFLLERLDEGEVAGPAPVISKTSKAKLITSSNQASTLAQSLFAKRFNKSVRRTN